MKTAKFNGVVYEVKSTGNRRGKSAKSYTDLNGYETDRPSTKRQQLGMYLNDNLVYTIGADGKSIYYGGSKHGEVFIRDTDLELLTHLMNLK